MTGFVLQRHWKENSCF